MRFLYNPLKTMRDDCPYRRAFVKLTMQHMRRRHMAWEDFDKRNGVAGMLKYGKNYNLMRRLKGRVVLLPEHIVTMADMLELRGRERDTFLMAGLLVIVPRRFVDLVRRGVPIPQPDEAEEAVA